MPRFGPLMALCLAATSAATPSGADSVPAGWSKNDFIAYLVLSDLLREMAKETDDIFIACVSNDIGLADGNRHGPSPRLMAALTSEFSRGGRNVPLHLASQCHEISVRVEEIATGRPAMWLYAADNAINSDLCGSYTAGWHHAGLWGGANFYNLVSREGRIAVKRGACVLME